VQSGPNSEAGVREGDVLAGKFRVERVLGVGGMGVVVAAHHLQLDQKVALKFLLPEALANPDAVARFAREARAAVKIQSEHVARVIDVGTLESGAPYMVMEYLEGGDLAGWLQQRGPLPVDQAVEFVLQACEALAEAHALGIIHRDLKPANLFCIRRADGRLSIKVLDFGISKMTEVGISGPGAMTHATAIMGSPLYMSPEQMRSAKEVNSQTDIWALGVILFELITGKQPFVAESLPELFHRVGSEPPPPLRGFRPEVPAALEAVISRCLEKERQKRYPNVGGLSLALLPFAPKRAKASVERISGIIQAAGLSESALAVPVSPQAGTTQVSAGTLPGVGRTTGVATQRSSAWMGAGLLLGVLVIGATVTIVFLHRRAPPPPEDPHAAMQSGPAAAPASPFPTMPSPSPPETAATDAAKRVEAETAATGAITGGSPTEPMGATAAAPAASTPSEATKAAAAGSLPPPPRSTTRAPSPSPPPAASTPTHKNPLNITPL
jgi:serine/threonine-protein kinase